MELSKIISVLHAQIDPLESELSRIKSKKLSPEEISNIRQVENAYTGQKDNGWLRDDIVLRYYEGKIQFMLEVIPIQMRWTRAQIALTKIDLNIVNSEVSRLLLKLVPNSNSGISFSTNEVTKIIVHAAKKYPHLDNLNQEKLSNLLAIAHVEKSKKEYRTNALQDLTLNRIIHSEENGSKFILDDEGLRTKSKWDEQNLAFQDALSHLRQNLGEPFSTVGGIEDRLAYCCGNNCVGCKNFKMYAMISFGPPRTKPAPQPLDTLTMYKSRKIIEKILGKNLDDIRSGDDLTPSADFRSP